MESQPINTKGKVKWSEILSNLLVGIMGVVIIGMLVLLFQNRGASGPPSVLGHQIYVVMSGSMSPTFDTGSLILVQQVEPEAIQTGDMITYRDRVKYDLITTHRVMEIQGQEPLQVITRGDANNMNDPIPVSQEQILGRVRWAIPRLGYAFAFARTRYGFLLLMILPAMIIILTQLHSLYRYIKEEKQKAASTTQEP